MYSDAQAAARPAKCFLDFSILSLLMLAAFQFLALDFFMAFALSLGFHAIVPCLFFSCFFPLLLTFRHMKYCTTFPLSLEWCPLISFN